MKDGVSVRSQAGVDVQPLLFFYGNRLQSRVLFR